MIDPNKIFDAILSGKANTIGMERVINSLTRYESRTPTGVEDKKEPLQ